LEEFSQEKKLNICDEEVPTKVSNKHFPFSFSISVFISILYFCDLCMLRKPDLITTLILISFCFLVFDVFGL